MGDAGISWEGLRWSIAQICEEKGWHHGVPLPSSTDHSRRIVLARGCPLSDIHGHGKAVAFDGKQKDDSSDVTVVNKWTPPPLEVTVLKDEKGIFSIRMPVGHMRLKIIMDTMVARGGSVGAETEIKAMRSLAEKISETQWDSYIISGMFPETSKRSGVTYILRKGLPTLAVKCTPVPEGGEKRHFLAALCCHPLGWYEGTWAGVYPPTDDVIAHLLLIRGDEHGFWKKSTQHSINDPLAGI